VSQPNLFGKVMEKAVLSENSTVSDPTKSLNNEQKQ